MADCLYVCLSLYLQFSCLSLYIIRRPVLVRSVCTSSIIRLTSFSSITSFDGCPFYVLWLIGKCVCVRLLLTDVCFNPGLMLFLKAYDSLTVIVCYIFMCVWDNVFLFHLFILCLTSTFWSQMEEHLFAKCVCSRYC